MCLLRSTSSALVIVSFYDFGSRIYDVYDFWLSESTHFLGHLIQTSLIVSETWILLLFLLWWKISYLSPLNFNSACEEEAEEVQACLGNDRSHTALFILNSKKKFAVLFELFVLIMNASVIPVLLLIPSLTVGDWASAHILIITLLKPHILILMFYFLFWILKATFNSLIRYQDAVFPLSMYVQ